MFTPDYVSATGLLSHLNSEELKELLNDEQKLELMIKDLEQVKQVHAEKEMILASNKSLAEYNLSLRPELEQSRQDLILQYEMVSNLKANVQKLHSQMVSKKCQTSLDTVLALLQTSTAQSEEAAESLFENLMERKSNIDTFLHEFVKERTNMHLRRAKSEKMAALLPGGHYRSPPVKPRRLKKAPPPPPTIKKPFDQAAGMKPGPDQIVPTRIAPHPPVVIPRRQSNTPPSSSSQPFQRVPCSSNVSYPYPQPVKLSH